MVWVGFADGCIHAYYLSAVRRGAAEGGRVELWSAMLFARRAHHSAVTGLVVSRDSAGAPQLVTASAHGTIRRWAAALAPELAAVRARRVERALLPRRRLELAVATWNVNATLHAQDSPECIPWLRRPGVKGGFEPLGVFLPPSIQF